MQARGTIGRSGTGQRISKGPEFTPGKWRDVRLARILVVEQHAHALEIRTLQVAAIRIGLSARRDFRPDPGAKVFEHLAKGIRVAAVEVAHWVLLRQMHARNVRS